MRLYRCSIHAFEQSEAFEFETVVLARSQDEARAVIREHLDQITENDGENGLCYSKRKMVLISTSTTRLKRKDPLPENWEERLEPWSFDWGGTIGELWDDGDIE